MNVSNQKPAVLTPVYKDDIKVPYDPLPIIKGVFATPLFNPISTNYPVTISHNGQDITEDDIVTNVLTASSGVYDPAAESFLKTLFGKTLINFKEDTTLNASEAFLCQSAKAAGLPEPNALTVYTPATDIIPTMRRFIAGQASYDEWFASLGLYARPNTLGFYFINENSFNDFKTWLMGEINMIQSVLSPDVFRMFTDFNQLTFNSLTESLLLRANDNDSHEAYSFPRVLVFMLMEYTNQVSAGEFGILPFSVPELLNPKSIVFVNVEKHARATPQAIATEWNIINNSIQNKPKMISNNKLKKLTAAERTRQKIAAQAANAATNAMQQAIRAQNFKFRKTRPSTVDFTRYVKKIMEKMAFVSKSMNIYKAVKATYAKPNRRNPDDFNKQGKMVSTRYKPDIHLYIDTSGSISERDYQDTVKACIALAKKLNVNLFFNSFSHIMSQTTRLHTKDKTREAIFKEFQKVPKVSGGTDYEQIWHFINQSAKRTREISLLITDFEYYAPTAFVKHPKNLYYVPCSNFNWDTITRNAENFCKSMTHNDPTIRTRLLF